MNPLWLPPFTGIELRLAMVVCILDCAGPITVTQLIDSLDPAPWPSGRRSKVVSDTLRWEVRKGRVRRVGRGLYAPGRVPRSTEWWMRDRVGLWREELARQAAPSAPEPSPRWGAPSSNVAATTTRPCPVHNRLSL